MVTAYVLELRGGVIMLMVKRKDELGVDDGITAEAMGFQVVEGRSVERIRAEE